MKTNDEPWREAELAEKVVEITRSLPRRPLSEPAPAGPGVYGLYVASSRAIWGPAGTGTSCSYIGSAVNLAPRLGRHRTSFREAEGVEPAEIWFSAWVTPSWGAALYGEYLLVSALRPILNVDLPGLGSQRPGTTRRGKPSPFDCVFPRSWVRQPTPIETGAAAVRLVAALGAPGRLRTLWKPLPRAV